MLHILCIPSETDFNAISYKKSEMEINMFDIEHEKFVSYGLNLTYWSWNRILFSLSGPQKVQFERP